jgi:xanthine dehydrogenase molybdopterin-binding subunit B
MLFDISSVFAEGDGGDMQVKGHERSYSEGAAGTVADGPSVKLEKKSSNQNQTSVKQIISQLMTSTVNACVIQVSKLIF